MYLKEAADFAVTVRQFPKYLENLYGAGIGVGVLKRGDDHILHVAFETISDNMHRTVKNFVTALLTLCFQ